MISGFSPDPIRSLIAQAFGNVQSGCDVPPRLTSSSRTETSSSGRRTTHVPQTFNVGLKCGRSVLSTFLERTSGTITLCRSVTNGASLKISLAHDLIASPRLSRLSRDVDLFVFASSSATHAASDCIMAHRGGRPLAYAVGRGFSSLVRAVEDYFERAGVGGTA